MKIPVHKGVFGRTFSNLNYCELKETLSWWQRLKLSLKKQHWFFEKEYGLCVIAVFWQNRWYITNVIDSR